MSIFRHSGTQSPTIFDESIGRWLVYNEVFKDFNFFYHDIDHVGTKAIKENKEFKLTSISESNTYSAFSYYFPFFSKIGRVSFEDFIKEHEMPRKKSLIALKKIENSPAWKRQRISAIPVYDSDDTIRSMESKNDVKKQNILFSLEALKDIEKILVNDEQRNRLEIIKKVISLSSNKTTSDLKNIYNEQLNKFAEILGFKEINIQRTSDFFYETQSDYHRSLLKDSILKDTKFVELYNGSIKENKLPYRKIVSLEKDLPFSWINVDFKRYKYEKDKTDCHIIIGHNAFHFTLLALILDRKTVVHSGGEKSDYHQIVDISLSALDIDKTSVELQYDENRFFESLKEIKVPIRVPLWLQKDFNQETVSLKEFILAIEEIIENEKKKNNKSFEVKGFQNTLEFYCPHGSIMEYRGIIEKSKKLKKEAFTIRDIRNKKEEELIIEAFFYWCESKHRLSLERFNSRGSHLLWLFILAGKDGVNTYINKLIGEVKKNAII